ncbi:DNA polymerase III subunit epsilon [Moraxella macacae 0408225]|uniref:DNA polymerase III subunit epsilon n=1 Tax=Moraxella macacae 0408225 TaxID=1230338 RepID=L2F505_9GAMM|nr:3'-5' exonuclease [Moraxella macacae]ELA08087.1 DNA polymerase III subunit epsilon [Moraxella macacae 0408225]
MNFFKKLFNKNYKFNHLRRKALAKLNDDGYRYLFDDTMTDEWVCLDFEMTGIDPKRDQILSVGAVKIVKDQGFFTLDMSTSLSMICRTPIMPPPASIVVHGIRPMDLEAGVDYDTILKALLPLVGSRPIVGFCPQMDKAFLNVQVKNFLGTELINPCIDVSIMEKNHRQKLMPNPDMIAEQKHLTTLLAEYNIPLLPAHDALNDAIMTAMLFCKLMNLTKI